MSLSVVIPHYRQLRCLDLTLGALADRSPDPGPFEVLVVDDDSGDGVAPVVARHRDRLPVRLLRQPVNRGRAAARNRGAAEASGERLLFLDADSLADPALLAAHARFHRTHPDKVLLGARREGDWGAAAGAPAVRAGEGRGPAYGQDMRYRTGLDPAAFDRHPVPWIFGYSHNMSVPADAFRACGGFDEAFAGWGHEDLELSYRLFTAAGRAPGHFRFDPDALCHHLPHFRRERDNWAQAERMLPYITEKHRGLETEFVEEGPLSVCDTLPVYLRRLRLLHAAVPGAARDEALAALPAPLAPGRLVVGAGLAKRSWEPAEGGPVELIDHRPPESGEAPGLVGIHLPYPDHRFADLVNLDLWRVLTPEHLSRLILEGLRVARAVYLCHTKSVPGAAAAGLAGDPEYVCDLLAACCDARVVHDGERTAVIRAKRR
ncbi:glycosyltransferase [Streptomyces sp. NPDC048845]|uniref:glycosyltransferase family 2 protein n=1 Tax=Streptomyces sp. NPDC048845 TaxID=3155390 RepID=UPI00342AF55F